MLKLLIKYTCYLLLSVYQKFFILSAHLSSLDICCYLIILLFQRLYRCILFKATGSAEWSKLIGQALSQVFFYFWVNQLQSNYLLKKYIQIFLFVCYERLILLFINQIRFILSAIFIAILFFIIFYCSKSLSSSQNFFGF